MKTKELGLKTDWIRTYSLSIGWYSNGQMRWRYKMKDDKPHGDSRGWYNDGSVWFHDVWENGKRIKKIV